MNIYPEEFKQRVIEAYPYAETLHRMIRTNDRGVGRELEMFRNIRNKDLLEKILTCISFEGVISYCKERLEMHNLYEDWCKIIGDWK